MRKAKEQPDPQQFGPQLDGSYLPSPDEIREACSAIQATWSHAERTSRGLNAVTNKLQIKRLDGDGKDIGIPVVKDPGIR